ncbi:MAG: OmpA family protein [Bacteroidota bacterium]|nr:OmpA family protein [Bacteroidota bacterium]
MLMRFPVIAVLFFWPAHSFAQNLLLNGDFEEENICTEYKVNCAPEAWICNSDGFSNYFKDRNRAHSGEHFMAIEAGFTRKPFQRTYIRSRLLCGLWKDHRYRLEFYVRSRHPILDSIGVIFTPYDFLFGQKRLQNITPSLFIKPAKGAFVKDSVWQKVSMDYTARGDESFITIANFSRKDINGETNILMEKHFFVFLDDISLMPLDPRESLCPGWKTNKQNIYDQDERHEFLRQKIRQYKNDPPIVVIPSTSLSVIDTLVLPDVLFASGKAELQKSSYRMLDSFCRKLSGKKIDSIVVEGHTDNTGNLQGNEKLSLDRARAVETAIRQRLSSLSSAIITRGWADRKPLTDNSTPAGRQQNRRVEMFVYTRE